MSRQDTHVYDLGEIGRTQRPAEAKLHSSWDVRDRRGRYGEQPRVRWSPGPGLAGSLSIFLPGLGHMLAGEPAWGLFYLTTAGFLATLLWSIFATMDRLIATLNVLGVPTEAVVGTAGLLYLAAAGLHSCAALHAHALGTPARGFRGPNPVAAGIASLVVPGWGQMLSGHRGRATLFLGSVWVLGLCWIAVSPLGLWTLSLAGRRLPAAILEGWGPMALVSLTAVLWVIAVYDAAAGASGRRRRP